MFYILVEKPSHGQRGSSGRTAHLLGALPLADGTGPDFGEWKIRLMSRLPLVSYQPTFYSVGNGGTIYLYIEDHNCHVDQMTFLARQPFQG
jgi:hypothetical protein